MGKINPQTIPIGITNAVQAFALDLAGVTPAAQSCVNEFDPDILFALGGGKKDGQGNVTRPSRFNGMKPLDAARAAHQEGLQGRTYYRFERTKDLDRLCKAFTDQQKKVSAAGKEEGATLNTSEEALGIAKAMANGEMDQAEAIVRLTALVITTYIPYKNQWKKVTPLMLIPNAGRVEVTPTSDGGRIERKPGCRVVSVNASEETRKRLKL